MKREELVKRVTTLLVENLGVDEAEVTADASIVHDLGADSLDCVELILAAEEEFGVELGDEAEGRLEHATVTQAIDDIAAAIHAKAATTSR